jgi:[acyl-carrier-protein] S-malonyltransferase
MNCFMFPGQPFTESTALPADADWLEVVDLVRRHGHFDLVNFKWLKVRGTVQVGYQLQGVAWSLYQLRRLRCHGVWPDLVAQHSMGIYPALVACGCLSEAQAIEMTWRVGCCLAQMGGPEKWALGCVIGLTLEQLLPVVENNRVHVANLNTSRHFLLSGGKQEIAQAMAEALACGAFSARSFQCDAPIHSPLVAQLEQELEHIFSCFCYKEPTLPLMNHLNQCYLDAGDVPSFLLRELQLPVYWERTYRALGEAGVARFFEVGEGETLKKFNRWIDGDTGKSVSR